MIEGEPIRALAREFGVSEAAIRGRKSSQVAEIKAVANQIVATERAVKALPIGAQITAHSLAAKLRSISDSLASAAELGAKTAHRLHSLANSEVGKVDDTDPLASVDKLRNVALLTKLGNDSAVIATNLMAANKDAAKRILDDEGGKADAAGGAVGVDLSSLNSDELDQLEALLEKAAATESDCP